MDIDKMDLGLGLEEQETFTIDFDDEGNVIEVDDSSDDKETEETTEEVEESIESEVEETESTEIEETQEEAQDNSENENPFVVFASILKEKEFLPDISDEDLAGIETEDDLAELMNKQMDNIVLSQLEEANEKSYGALAHFLNGGTFEEFASKFAKGEGASSVLNYKEEDITDNEDVQRKILNAYYKKTTKFSDKKIAKLIDNDVELGETDEIVAVYNELKELDKKEKEEFAKQSKQREVEAEENRKKLVKTYQDNTYNYDEFIPGKKIDKKVKEKVFNGIQPTMEKINKNLTKYAPILSYLDHYGMLDGDFSKVIKDIETKQTSKLASVIKNTSFSRKTDKSKKTEDFKDIIRKSIKNSPLQ